jgi:hypothetical protein
VAQRPVPDGLRPCLHHWPLAWFTCASPTQGDELRKHGRTATEPSCAKTGINSRSRLEI